MAYNTIGRVEFRVTSIDPLLERVRAYSETASANLAELEFKFEKLARDILIDAFAIAIDEQSDFFSEYGDQILDAVRQLPMNVTIAHDFFEIIIDFDSLGTYEELTEAYHYGASLAEGGQLRDFPSPGEGALKNDREQRLDFWHSVYTGEPYFHMITNEDGEPIGKGRDINTGGMLEETIAARVDYWESLGKAPEWLFLQFGQPLGIPTVEASHVIQKWENRAWGVLYQLFAENLAVPRGFAVAASGRSYYNVRSATGRFAKLEERYL